MQFQQLFNEIDRLMNHNEYSIVSIEGMSTAGKSTLAAFFKESRACNVISMDDFFLRTYQRTPGRLAEPGGNIDYERFKQEILIPLKSGKSFEYRPFNCQTMKLDEPVKICLTSLTVIEGVYCMHPYFFEAIINDSLYDISVFLKIDEDVQRQRLLIRNPDLYDRFIREWIPMENMYFKHFQIEEKCNFVYENEQTLF